ncbi:tRNA pseudouridine synthase A [Escherichia coli]|uniref:tRNA pseudouridine synthase A n=1 Tax=Escherichia coli TaxID=562 RepID=A0A376RGY3_ECOLX|nr:tRNA pseudouridine synthase A [Escherichia coli]
MSDQQQLPVYKIALALSTTAVSITAGNGRMSPQCAGEAGKGALPGGERTHHRLLRRRTDAGVHGTGQVVHFETTAQRKDAAWTLGVNANLPGDIAVRWG